MPTPSDLDFVAVIEALKLVEVPTRRTNDLGQYSTIQIDLKGKETMCALFATRQNYNNCVCSGFHMIELQYD